MDILLYMVLGCFSGFIAGLFGVGGGMVIVPVLVLVFSYLGFDREVITHLAIGTSLSVIVLTAISSIHAQHLKGAIRLDVFKKMWLGLVVGAVMGAWIAKLMPHQWLQLTISIFAGYVGVKMLNQYTAEKSAAPTENLPSSATLALSGSGIGLLSAIFGIAGGTFTVPYLTRYGVQMQQAVATSAACGLPISLAGAMGFMFFGRHTGMTPEHAIGFVYVPALLGISVTSIFTAKLGVKVAHKLPADRLKKVFAYMLLVVAVYFAGSAYLDFTHV